MKISMWIASKEKQAYVWQTSLSVSKAITHMASNFDNLSLHFILLDENERNENNSFQHSSPLRPGHLWLVVLPTIGGMAARQINLATRTGSLAALNRASEAKSKGSIRLYYGARGWSIWEVLFEMQSVYVRVEKKWSVSCFPSGLETITCHISHSTWEAKIDQSIRIKAVDGPLLWCCLTCEPAVYVYIKGDIFNCKTSYRL